MSDFAELLKRAEELFESERQAIVELDSERVTALELEKHAIEVEMARLVSGGVARGGVSREDRAHVERVVSLARRSCMLLAHARDLTRSLATLESSAAEPSCL
ncbi:MAG: hypothetical protein U0271_31790 [Polyangiaceae bacterium]